MAASSASARARQLRPICPVCVEAGAQPGSRLCGQRRVVTLPGGQCQHRPDRATVGQGRLARSGDGRGRRQRDGKGGVARRQLLRRQPVQRDRVVAVVEAVGGGQCGECGVAGDGGQQVQPVALLWRQAIDRLRGHDADAKARGQRLDCLAERGVAGARGVDRQPGALAKDARQPAHHAPRRRGFAPTQQVMHPAAPPARQTDQPGLVRFDRVPGEAGVNRAGAGGRTLQCGGKAGKVTDSPPARSPAA
jgi:hypothetical protein